MLGQSDFTTGIAGISGCRTHLVGNPPSCPAGQELPGPTASTLTYPGDVAVDGSGNVYVADMGDNNARLEADRMVLDDADIGLLDSGVPEWARRRLIEPHERDSKRVLLMTSSGSRGVGFLLATVIIAHVPRFAAESGFMEIVQFVYRGRGSSESRHVDGDALDRVLATFAEKTH